MTDNNFPKLHNAAWPGVVGKGGDDAEPPIDLDTMLDLTAAAEVDGVKFDGFDLFLFDPHISIDAEKADLKCLAEKAASRNLAIGSVVAPVWPSTGGGSAMGTQEDCKKFLTQVKKGCGIAQNLREMCVRPVGVVRVDSGVGPGVWQENPVGNTKKIAATFREAAKIAQDHGERLACEGEICWGGMHSWKDMVDLLEEVGMPEAIGFQADLAHTYLYLMGYNAPEHALLQEGYSKEEFASAYTTMTDALRPWTIDFHVAQNDGTVHGSGSHGKTGRHCLVDDPNGKVDITQASGYWLREGLGGETTRAFHHICWDGCMFSNDTMKDPNTWNTILAAMIDVRAKHGWQD